MRLGDLDALKKALDEQMINFEENCRDSVFDLIDNAPTVEGVILTEEAYSDLCLRASKIRPHGEWLPNYTSQFFNPGRSCSLCGKIVEFSENYCPKCGAEMEIDDERN